MACQCNTPCVCTVAFVAALAARLTSRARIVLDASVPQLRSECHAVPSMHARRRLELQASRSAANAMVVPEPAIHTSSSCESEEEEAMAGDGA